MFSNRSNNNNTQQKNSITTRGVQFYNSFDEDSSTLSLQFWNNYAVLKINPILPEKERSDNQVYNYDVDCTFMLKIKEIQKLIKGIALLKKQKVAPVEESTSKKGKKDKTDKKFFNFAIESTNGNIIKIGDGSEYEGMGWYLAIIDNSGKNPVSMFYQFNTKSDDDIIFFNYDEEENKGEKKYVATELELFEEYLEEAKKGFLSGIAHGINLQFNYFKKSIDSKFDILKGLAEASIASGSRQQNSFASGFNSGGGNGGGFSRKQKGLNGMGNKNNSRFNKKGKADVEEVDDISSIEDEMMDDE
jgi:hypothetical protein